MYTVHTDNTRVDKTRITVHKLAANLPSKVLAKSDSQYIWDQILTLGIKTERQFTKCSVISYVI